MQMNNSSNVYSALSYPPPFRLHGFFPTNPIHLSYSNHLPPQTHLVIVFTRLLLFLFLLLLLALLAVAFLGLELFCPHVVRRVFVEIREDDVENFLVP